jgi:hypothetical protein
LTADGGRPVSDRPAQAVFGLLVLACFAAFFVTQRLKHTPTALQEFHVSASFEPGLPGVAGEERISFKPARTDTVTVAIVSSDGGQVATLLSGWPVERYKKVYVRWNGRRGPARGHTVLLSPHGLPILLPTNTGAFAPAGEYRVRVTLRSRRTPVLSPEAFKLVGR